jgi:hypothetical protein
VYKKKYKHLQYKIDIVRLIIKIILYYKTLYFNNMFGQTLSNLALTKPRMQGKKDRGSSICSVQILHMLPDKHLQALPAPRIDLWRNNNNSAIPTK